MPEDWEDKTHIGWGDGKERLKLTVSGEHEEEEESPGHPSKADLVYTVSASGEKLRNSLYHHLNSLCFLYPLLGEGLPASHFRT